MASPKRQSKILIGQMVEVPGPDDIKEFQVIRECWAEIQNLRDREFFEASAYQNEKVIKLKIKYTSVHIDESMQLKFKNNLARVFNIISVDDINYEHKFYYLRAKEVTQNGIQS